MRRVLVSLCLTVPELRGRDCLRNRSSWRLNRASACSSGGVFSNSCLVYKTVTCQTTVGVSVRRDKKKPKQNKSCYSMKTSDDGDILRQELKYRFKDRASPTCPTQEEK